MKDDVACEVQCTFYEQFICRSFAFYPSALQCFISGDDTGTYIYVCTHTYTVCCMKSTCNLSNHLQPRPRKKRSKTVRAPTTTSVTVIPPTGPTTKPTATTAFPREDLIPRNVSIHGSANVTGHMYFLCLLLSVTRRSQNRSDLSYLSLLHIRTAMGTSLCFGPTTNNSPFPPQVECCHAFITKHVSLRHNSLVITHDVLELNNCLMRRKRPFMTRACLSSWLECIPSGVRNALALKAQSNFVLLKRSTLNNTSCMMQGRCRKCSSNSSLSFPVRCHVYTTVVDPPRHC